MLTPFELRGMVSRLDLLEDGIPKSLALLTLYRTVLLECASRNCPDPKTLSREALLAERIEVK